MVECEECDGSGVSPCYACGSEVDCEDCNGTGEVESTEEENV